MDCAYVASLCVGGRQTNINQRIIDTGNETTIYIALRLGKNVYSTGCAVYAFLSVALHTYLIALTHISTVLRCTDSPRLQHIWPMSERGSTLDLDRLMLRSMYIQLLRTTWTPIRLSAVLIRDTFRINSWFDSSDCKLYRVARKYAFKTTVKMSCWTDFNGTRISCGNINKFV